MSSKRRVGPCFPVRRWQTEYRRPHAGSDPVSRVAVVAVALALAGCSLAPPYERPTTPAPPSFKESPATGTTWFPAAPADELDRGPWWHLFDDPVLTSLVSQVQVSNQNVAAAAAAYAQSQALVREARASLFPSLSLDASATKNGGGREAARPSSFSVALGAAWEPDLWGRLRLGVTTAQASAQASAADLAAATLSAQAAVATDYFALREADNEIALLTSAVEAYSRSYKITLNQYDAGIVARTDVLQAQTQLDTTQANREAMMDTRARLEHAIAVLIGQAPADFGLTAGTWNQKVPAIPLVVPSDLLQRRPDIAAAERNVAAANAQIGIQRAAYFPSLGLSASAGQASPLFATLFSASDNVWSLGLSIAQTIFDAGATAAKVEAAQAGREQSIAVYRQTVLAAFQTVEDQLSTLHSLAEQEGARRAASEAADRVEQLTMNQYLQGQIPYTTVVTAQVTALNARQALSQLMSSRQAAAIALIQALGGGWQGPEPNRAAGITHDRQARDRHASAPSS